MQQQQQLYQPPEKMFLFEGGWKILYKGITAVWNAAQRVFNWFFGLASIIGEWIKRAFFLFVLPGFFVALLFAILGCLLFAILAIADLALILVFGALLFVLMSGAAALLALLVALSKGYTSWFHIHYRCPNMHCYQEMESPLYQCPHCFLRHKALVPSTFGIFWHRCHCGKRLSTLDRFGRGALQRYCASCGSIMDKEIGKGTNIDIPVIGGRAWGKTTYLVSATALLKNHYASSSKRYRIEFTNRSYQSIFVRNLQHLQQGKKLNPTIDQAPNAYCLKIKRGLVPKLLFFYDAGGEAFTSSGKMYWHTYYQYIRGLIFIIDPFAIAAFRRDHPREVAQLGQEIAPARPDIEEIGNRLIGAIEQYRGVKKGRSHKVPLAVVVTKVDMLNLEHEIGFTAAQHWLTAINSQASSQKNIDDALQAVVKEFLRKNGLNNLMEQFEAYFSEVGYFSCSALGSMPETSTYRFSPIRTLEPLQWLLQKNGLPKD